MNLWVPWTDERVEQLLKRTREGESASQIAAALGGGLTRNAVVGKWHRLRKDGRDIITPPKRVAAPPAAEIKPPYLSEAKAAPPKLLLDVSLSNIHFTDRGRTYNKCAPSKFAPRKPPTTIQSLSEPKPLRLALEDLSSQTCRWPIGDVGAPDFCYCGHQPSPGSSYCEYHRRVSRNDTQPRISRKFG